ncbi:MAG: hypothetical protein L6R45_10945 [Anaerolineae bacterium]|nr:hypothetical protein [Anaerolineae bacterium]
MFILINSLLLKIERGWLCVPLGTAAGTELANFGILNTPAYNALATMPK